MVDIFDKVATVFGMVIAIDKTKVICNAISKAMHARDLQTTEEVRYYHTRGGHTQMLEEEDGRHIIPKLLIRGKVLARSCAQLQISGPSRYRGWISGKYSSI